jgi:PAS domain S-box-containing protein
LDTPDSVSQELTRWQQALLESAPDAMIVTDPSGKILLVNSQTEKIFGYSRDELLGQPIEMLMPSRFRADHAQHRTEFAAAPRFRAMGEGFDLYALHKSGREFPVEISLSPLNTGQGMVFTSAIRDITQRKAIENAARQLAGMLLRSQDDERRRIARELHDSAGQMVAALLMNIDLLKGATTDQKKEDLLCDMTTILKSLNTELRTMSHLLHPPLLDEVGLSSALQWYVDGFSKRSGIVTTLEIPVGLERLPPDLEIAIFRVVQESLTNVHRHAGSKRAVVRLTRSQAALKMEIQDEGKGISPSYRSQILTAAPLGVGLRGMHERVLQLGGKLDIRSDESGTIVCATFSIAKDNSQSAAQ